MRSLACLMTLFVTSTAAFAQSLPVVYRASADIPDGVSYALCEALNGEVRLRLPRTPSNHSVSITIKKVDWTPNACVIDAAEPIDGGSYRPLALSTPQGSISLFSAPSMWFVQ